MKSGKLEYIIIIALATLLLFGGFFLARDSYTPVPFYLAFLIWVATIFGCILHSLKSIRIFITILGVNFIAAPFAFLLTYRMSWPVGAQLFFIIMAAWSLMSGLITRSARGFYWSLHMGAWAIGFALTSIPYYNGEYYYYYPSWFWMFFPIGVSLALFGQYANIIEFLSRWSFLREKQIQPQSPPTLQPSYEQGYQTVQPATKPAYEEGGKLYPYPEQATHEQAKAHYPEGMIQS